MVLKLKNNYRSWPRNIQSRGNEKRAQRWFEKVAAEDLADEEREEDPANEEIEEDTSVALVTQVNKILHSIFSSVEVYISNHQVTNQKVWVRANLAFQTNSRIKLWVQRVVDCEGDDYDESPNEIQDAPLFELFFTLRLKTLSKPDGFMLNDKLNVEFFTNSDLIYPIKKNRLPLFRARYNFYIISDNPSVSLGIVDCWLYTRCFALKEYYQKKNAYACEVQLFGDSSTDFYHSR